MKTIYLLNETGGLKLSASLGRNTIQLYRKHYLSLGYKEVPKAEYDAAKKAFSKHEKD